MEKTLDKVPYEYKDLKLLEKFMKEFFDFKGLVKAGFFTKEMKGDYVAQANRVSTLFGYENVFEYGSEEVVAHLSYAEGKRPENEPFVTVIPNIYES